MGRRVSLWDELSPLDKLMPLFKGEVVELEGETEFQLHGPGWVRRSVLQALGLQLLRELALRRGDMGVLFRQEIPQARDGDSRLVREVSVGMHLLRVLIGEEVAGLPFALEDLEPLARVVEELHVGRGVGWHGRLIG